MSRALRCSSAIALVLLASGASADVTPQEVWESWQAMATSAGQEITIGGTAQTGETLEATEVVITYKDELGGSASVVFDKLTFADNGDGTVTVTMPDSYPISLAFPSDAAEAPGSLKMTVTQPGMRIVAAGSATETSYDFSAPSVAVTLDEVKDETGTVLDTKGSLTLSEVTSAYLVARSNDTTALDMSFGAKSMAFDLSGTGPDDEGSGAFSLTMSDITGSTKGNLLGADLMANMATALREGFTTDSSFSFGAMSVKADVTDSTGPFSLSGSATGGSLVLAVNKDRMVYGTSLQGAKFTASGADIPFPQVDLAVGEYALKFDMPVMKSDAPQDFAFLAKLVDFTVSEDIWGLIDPAASLSREPASFILDLKGTGFWTQDIMDPEASMDGVEPPGELHSLDLTQFLTKGAGAEVSATGGLKFDNSDLASFGGVPRPEGLITVNIKGVNKLIENLIALGVLTEDDAMGFRMGLAMFARPGAGPDELTSEIEFKDGGLFANGQQLQ